MLYVMLRTLISAFRSRGDLAAENLALRHQLNVLQRSVKKRRLRPTSSRCGDRRGGDLSPIAVAEPLCGTAHRLDPSECLDHVIVLNGRQLRRLLRSYFAYYHGSRTHLGLEKDCTEPRPAEPADLGPVLARSMAGGLHHRYFRRAA